MPCERKSGLGRNGREAVVAAEFGKPVPQGFFLFRQTCEVAQLAQGLFGHVADEIAHIQRRVTPAVQVKIKQVKTVSMHNHLVRVEVPMNATGFWLRQSGPQAVTGSGESLHSSRQIRLMDGHFGQTPA